MADSKEKPKLLGGNAKIFMYDGIFKEAPAGFDDFEAMFRWKEAFDRTYGRRKNPEIELARVLEALKEATEIEPDELIPALRIAGYQIEANYSDAEMEVVVRFRRVKS